MQSIAAGDWGAGYADLSMFQKFLCKDHYDPAGAKALFNHGHLRHD
jgi:hypothetical protein